MALLDDYIFNKKRSQQHLFLSCLLCTVLGLGCLQNHTLSQHVYCLFATQGAFTQLHTTLLYTPVAVLQHRLISVAELSM